MPKLICVVDDNKSFQELCARILEPAGYRCAPLLEYERTIEEIKQLQPDLVLMDLRLGELDGMEVLNGLDADPETAGIPVVICTAAHDLVERHHARLDELGCETVEKPFEIDDLLAAIERCLARGASRTDRRPNAFD